MKLLALCCLACVVVIATAAPQIKLPQATEEELSQMLSTRAKAKEFVNCIKRPKDCSDPRANAIARLAPMLLRTQGRCKGIKGISCNAQDEKNIKFVVGTLSNKYNGLYNNLIRSLLRGV